MGSGSQALNLSRTKANSLHSYNSQYPFAYCNGQPTYKPLYPQYLSSMDRLLCLCWHTSSVRYRQAVEEPMLQLSSMDDKLKHKKDPTNRSLHSDNQLKLLIS